MKKITFLITLFLTSYALTGQVLNQSASWPNTNWTVTGTYTATSLESDPTIDSNFSFNDDTSGNGVDDDVAAESPVIDLTAAFAAGEFWLSVNIDHVLNGFNVETLGLQYWDADASVWVNWSIPTTADTAAAPTSNFCGSTFEPLNQGVLNISGFTATQQSGFRYRIAYDDNGTWGWGFCVNSPTITSQTPPSCPDPTSITVSNVTDTSAEISWIETGTATNWTIEYGPSGFTPGTGTIINATTIPFTLTGLNATTQYDIYLQSNCGGTSGDSNFVSALGLFTTPQQFNYTLDCASGGPETVDYCYNNNGAADVFTFTSNDGSPLTLVFNSGNVEVNWDEVVVIDSNGTPFPGYDPVDQNYGNNGDLSGLTFQSTGDTISFYINSDGSVSCQSGSVGLVGGINFTVSCATCVNPQATYTVVDDCANGNQFLVDVDITDLGSATSLTISNDFNATTVPNITGTGVQQVGPFPLGTNVQISVSNDQDINCIINSQSLTLDNCPPPAPVGVTCGTGSSTFIFTEDFDSDPPVGWTGNSYDGTNGNWDITSENANSFGTGPDITYDGNPGTHLEYEASGNATNIASAISPAIDLSSALDGAELSFFFHAFGADMGTLNVNVIPQSTGVPVNVFTWVGDLQTTATEAWVPVGIDISAYLGEVINVEFSYGGAGTGFEGDMSIDFIRVETCGTFCIAPSNVTIANVTDTQAEVSWVENNGGVTTWDIEYGPAGFTPGTGTTVAGVTTNPFTITGLSASTVYDVYVYSVCSPTTTSIAGGPGTFTTLNTPPPAPVGVTCGTGSSTFIFTEDFDSDPPVGWTGNSYDGANGNWDITSENANSFGTGPDITYDGNPGTHLEYEASGNATNIASAISPAIDLSSALDGAELSFFFHAFGADMGTLNVNVIPQSTGVPVNVFTWVGDLQTTATEAWVPVGIDISAYLGEVINVEFSYGGAGTGFEGDFAIDYVRVEACGTFCLAPIDLAFINPTPTSIDFTWTPLNGETQWEYFVVPAGSPVPTPGTGTITNTNTVTVSGLNFQLLYDFYVMANCPTLDSIIAGPVQFDTTNLIVDQTTYTTEGLVDVLFGSPCANISNIVSSTGTDFGEENGIGYFINYDPSFPFQEGVVLSTGDAKNSEGPNDGLISEGTSAWLGDQDLDVISGGTTNNATFIQFDFVAFSDQLNFDFLMASEEYDAGFFECNFSDAFAFLLTDAAGNTINLAVLPGTNTPILVTNVHPANNSCPAINEQFFGGYTPFNGGPTAFDGRTVALTATANLVPGQTYNIKLVVADEGDSAYNTAVFLKAGDFIVDGEVEITSSEVVIDPTNGPNDLDVVNPVCGFNSVLLEATFFADGFQWYQNGNPIPGATSNTLQVTQSGEYQVEALYFNCPDDFSQPVQITMYDESPTVTPGVLTLCDNDANGTELFDLDAYTASLGLPSGFTVTYYTNINDANQAINSVSSPYASSGEQLFVRVEDTDAFNDGFLGCRQIPQAQLELVLNPAPVINQPSDLEACVTGQSTFDLTTVEPQITTDPSVTISYHTSQSDADAGTPSIVDPSNYVSSATTIYVRVENAEGCYSTTSFGLSPAIQPLASIDPQYVLEVCPQAQTDSSFNITIGLIAENFTLSEVDIEWYDPSGNLISGATGLTYNGVDAPGTYEVVITYNQGLQCSTSVFIDVASITCVIPEGISPGLLDGLNDTLDLTPFRVSNIQIFNRNGSKVYEKNNYTNEWDGRSSGGDVLPVGTYFFTMVYLDGKTHTGWVYINR